MCWVGLPYRVRYLTNKCSNGKLNKKTIKSQVLSKAHNQFNLMLKGPFIFYEVGGAGGIWGGSPKKNRLKGGAI